MAILGIDFGKKRVGLALSESLVVAEPLRVLTYSSISALMLELNKIAEEYTVDRIVVGVPGKDVIGARAFGLQLEERNKIPVSFISEDLTSWQVHQERRKPKSDDDLAAVLILQDYLDSKDG